MHPALRLLLALTVVGCSSSYDQWPAPTPYTSDTAPPPVTPPPSVPLPHDTKVSDPPPPATEAKSVWVAPVAGTHHVLSSAGDTACTFELAYVQQNEGVTGVPPVFTTFLEKRDTSTGSCNELKGTIVLTLDTYLVVPKGAMARHATDELLVIAFSERNSVSGTAPTFLRLHAFDGKTGAQIADGGMAVKGASAGPPAPALQLGAVAVQGRDVLLSGTGSFPGSVGTGTSFAATYLDFLELRPQVENATLADSAVQL